MLAAALLALPMWQGCVSSSKVESSVSVGQQLQDLETARKNGTINDKEYQRLRKALIKKYD